MKRLGSVFLIAGLALAIGLALAACGAASAGRAVDPDGDEGTQPVRQLARAEQFAQLESELETLRQQLRIPGFSAAVVQDQELVWATGFGFADLEGEIPASADTPYRLASVTKPIGATLLMQLVEEGLIGLDDPVSDYGVDVESEGAVLVWHLLTHTSEGEPGAVHRYDGGRYDLLRTVIEGATGSSLETLFYERIFDPAGMSRTAPAFTHCDLAGYLAQPDLDAHGLQRAAVYRDLAKPYRLDRSYTAIEGGYPAHFGVSAGLVSTVRDLAAFDIALDQGRLLAPQTQADMHAPRVSTSPGRADLQYALGWYVQDFQGTRLVWHAGRWGPSISSLYVKVPDQGLTFIILANTDNLGTPHRLGAGDVMYSAPVLAFFRNLVYPRLHGATHGPIDWEAPASELVENLSLIESADERLLRERELWSTRQVFGSVGRFSDAARLLAVQRRAFPDSEPTDLDRSLPSQLAHAPLLGEIPVDLSPADLAPLVGDYRLSQMPDIDGLELPKEVSVEIAGDDLYFCVPETGPAKLVALGPGRFRFMRMATAPEAYMTFEQSPGGMVAADLEVYGVAGIRYEREQSP